MYQESELINLCIWIIGFTIVLFVFSKNHAGELPPFYTGFYLLFGAAFFTVMEGYIWNPFFNFLEHLCLALSGIAFADACRTYFANERNKI